MPHQNRGADMIRANPKNQLHFCPCRVYPGENQQNPNLSFFWSRCAWKEETTDVTLCMTCDLTTFHNQRFTILTIFGWLFFFFVFWLPVTFACNYGTWNLTHILVTVHAVGLSKKILFSFWLKYDLGQKYRTPQVWPDQVSNS